MKTALILITALALMAFAVIGLSRPAHAQSGPICLPRPVLAAILADKFRQSPMVFGLEHRGGTMELFAADDGSWTMVAAGMSGNACIVASGTDLDLGMGMVLPKEGQAG